MFHTDGLKPRLDRLGACAGHAGVGHEHVGVAAPVLDESRGLLDFVAQIGLRQDVVAFARVLALDDECAVKVFLAGPLPCSCKGAVPAGVPGIKEGFDRLTENMPRHGET